MKQRRSVPQAVLLLILATFVLLTSAFSAAVPIFEAPDEPAHVDYVRFLRTQHRLPLQGETGEAHQPPLYYLPATLVSLPAIYLVKENDTTIKIYSDVALTTLVYTMIDNPDISPTKIRIIDSADTANGLALEMSSEGTVVGVDRDNTNKYYGISSQVVV